LLEYKPERGYLTHYGVLEQPQKKAQQLHNDLDAYVEIANNAKSDPNDRYQTILKNISLYHYEKVREHGCVFSDKELEYLIGQDLVLCAQGLEVWLQRQERS